MFELMRRDRGDRGLRRGRSLRKDYRTKCYRPDDVTGLESRCLLTVSASPTPVIEGQSFKITDDLSIPGDTETYRFDDIISATVSVNGGKPESAGFGLSENQETGDWDVSVSLDKAQQDEGTLSVYVVVTYSYQTWIPVPDDPKYPDGGYWSDPKKDNATDDGTIDVKDAALSPSSEDTVAATEGANVPSDPPLATFQDDNTYATKGDFTTTVDWGDGTFSNADVVGNGDGNFAVVAPTEVPKVYAEAGTYPVKISVTDDGGSTLGMQAQVVVGDAQLTANPSIPVGVTEGSAFAPVQVATFTDANRDSTSADFASTIDWGDGTDPSVGVVDGSGASGYTVSGSHNYGADKDGRTFTVTVTIKDMGGQMINPTTTLLITEAPLNVTNDTINPAEGVPFSDRVATFTDAYGDGTKDDYTATIDWGDGSGSVSAHLQPGAGPVQFFDVYPDSPHTYVEGGQYKLTVVVSEKNDTTATASDTSDITVSDPPLHATPVSIQGVEGTEISGKVASFTDDDPTATLADYSKKGATIDWGDGSSSSGSLAADPDGGVDVSAKHAYAEDGVYNVNVTLTDNGGATATAPSTAFIDDAKLTGKGLTASAVEGGSFSGEIATFTDANSLSKGKDYTVNINWGDGSAISGGTVVPDPKGGFDVNGTHKYGDVEEGTKLQVQVKIVDAGGAAAAATSTVVFSDAPLSAKGLTASSVEGAPFSGVIATFTDADPYGTVNDYTASITWGDGVISKGTVAADPKGGFDVSGTHNYGDAEEGVKLPVSVVVVDNGGSTSTASSFITVSDAPLTATGVTARAVEGAPFSDVIATFTDGDPYGTVNDYTASITWGDGFISNGTVAADPKGGFDVLGTHTYLAAGGFTVAVSIADAGGAGTLATSSMVSMLSVTTTTDSGPGSLRDAINVVNNSTTPLAIGFNILGTGPYVITPLSPLPVIHVPTIIDATTQPGYIGTPVVKIDGASAGPGTDGLFINGGGTSVLGLAIDDFDGSGIRLQIVGGNVVESCFIGVDLDGKTARGNHQDGIIINGSSASQNQIGGTVAGTGNVISGNGRSGVDLYDLTGKGVTANVVEGNEIGTDRSGTVALPNASDGVTVMGMNNTVGGMNSGARNLISGNAGNGVLLDGQGNLVVGNQIGTDVSGSKALGNALDGVQIKADSNTVGGTTLAARNTISANHADGISVIGFENPASNNLIEGNLVGVNAAGSAALGNAGSGVSLYGAANNIIGGATTGAGNVISANGGFGVAMFSDPFLSSFATGNLVEGNAIGSDAKGAVALGNSSGGVSIDGSSNTVGGTVAGTSNVIAFNGLNGVTIGTSSTYMAIDDPVLGNSIFANARLGIDLGNDGVTPNAPGGPHAGPNDFQNYPVLTSAVSWVSDTTITGTLNSTPSTAFRVEFFASPTADPTGYGQGQTYLGATTVTTDASGNRSFNLTLPVGGLAGQVLSATATDPSGNTSEFSGDLALSNPDTTPPTVASVTRLTPTAQFTNAASVVYRVTFSEHVNFVTATDFALVDVSNALTGDSITSVSTSTGTTIDVTVNTGTAGTGDLRLDVPSAGSTIKDDAGNLLATNYTTGQVYTIEHTPPTITSVGPVTPNPRNTSAPTVDVAFSEPIDLSTFDYNDLTLTRNGTAVTLTSAVTTSLVSGSTYQISGLAGVTGTDGNYVLTVNASGINDLAGNAGTGSASTSWVMDTVAPTITSVGPVTPNPRNTSVSTVDVAFSEPIDLTTFTAANVTLTRGGVAVSLSGVTTSLVSGSTYQISGLGTATALAGSYVLTVSATGVMDPFGNLGTNILSTSWLMDTTPPTSTVSPLPPRETSLVFPVSVNGSDGGSPPSGVASYDIYSSTNGGAWDFWTTVSTSSPTHNFTGQSNTTYAFYSIAHDLAGNTENKKPTIDASTYLPDLTPPVTSVDGTTGANPSSVNSSTGTFTLDLTGSDPGGGLLTYFEVFVSVDGGTHQEVGPYTIPAGAADSKGNYHSTIIYQGLTDGQSHTYSFYSIGLDAAGNLQSAPSGANVTFANQVFAVPGQLQVTGFTVEHGSPSRSFVRYLDLTFNESDSQSGGELTSIVNSIGTSSPDILIYKYNLDGSGVGTPVPLNSSPTVLDVLDHAIEIDFGSGGILGTPNTTAADGYYKVVINLPGQQPATHYFDRILGDVNGDGIVDSNDLNEIAASINETSRMGWTPLSADVTGAGVVTAFDLTLATRSKGRKLGSGLSLG